MMGVMDARNIQSNLAVNKYLHTVSSRWISSTQNNGCWFDKILRESCLNQKKKKENDGQTGRIL